MNNKKKVTQVEYDNKMKKFNILKKQLSTISRAKIDSAYSDPGNTWHDNFAYEQLDLQEDGLFNQLENLKSDIENCEIVIKGMVPVDNVDIYDKIKLIFTYEDGEQEQLILTLGDANDENSITLASPLGQSIYNQKYGTIVKYLVNNKPIQVEILKKMN